MNFMSYLAEVSRGWDEPNARDMGRMTSQPNAKGEMYILNNGIDMKAKIAAMARRLEELEMKKMQEVQAISQTPLQAMPWSICRSYEHLVDECPTIPTVREMFGDCNTYNSNWRDHPNFSWKPQPPQYQQPAQAPQQASNLHQAMVNLSKVVGDFVGAQKSINAQLSQRIDSVANLNTVQEKGNFPSRSGKEVDLPTSKLQHMVESETEKEKREEIKGKKKGKRIEKDDYDVNVQEEPQRIVIKEEMKKRMPPLFLQALRNVKRGERRKLGIKRNSKARREHGLRNFATKSKPLRKLPPVVKPFRSRPSSSVKIFRSYGIGCEIPHLLHSCENPLLYKMLSRCGNDLQASKWACYKNDLQNEESYQLRAPVEETMPSKETTITEVKVLIQPTQEATTDASAPQDLTIT
ncbi:hypothetical protein CK203_089434 [Vitis vinifera]|uniref:Uncharacterized protein n=1 Tax=Vitis vinifera TaxID=29760 RepID=A0A438E8V0_VITVI|nr:hypothetical protein CK203_089434 [Vitis vinifera]